jgi:RNA polymerase sigma factor (sigma-70 family)
MTEANWAMLQRLLTADYARMSKQLERVTGSPDIANEALQDTYLRLAQGGEIAGQLQSPKKYLFMMALNSARKILRRDRSRSRYIEMVGMFDPDILDETPNPEREAGARSDIQVVRAVLETMPERRRAIFVLALFDELPLADIAKRHGIGLRMVQIELKKARDEIFSRFQGLNVVDFASVSPNGSED